MGAGRKLRPVNKAGQCNFAAHGCCVMEKVPRPVSNQIQRRSDQNPLWQILTIDTTVFRIYMYWERKITMESHGSKTIKILIIKKATQESAYLCAVGAVTPVLSGFLFY